MDSSAIITGIFTILGAAIGFLGGIVSAWLMQRWRKKHDLEMLTRAKGEYILESLVKLVHWTGESLQKALNGEQPYHTSEIFLVHALVETYFPEQFHLANEIATETRGYWKYLAESANSIKNDPKTLDAFRHNVTEKIKPLSKVIGALEKELVLKLKIKPQSV